MSGFIHSETSRFKKFSRREEESQDIPLSTETPVANPEQIPFAQQIFDTSKLYRRWAICCNIALRMAQIGLEHADYIQTQATIRATIGLMFGSQHMQESALESNRQAHETRKSTLYFAFIFLLVSVVATTIYWAVEEGLVGTIVKSVAACGRTCVNAITNAVSWIKDKTTTQHDNLKKSSEATCDLQEEEEQVLDAVPVANVQNLSDFKQRTFMPSGGYPTPSAPPAYLFNLEEEPRPRSRSSSLTKCG